MRRMVMGAAVAAVMIAAPAQNAQARERVGFDEAVSAGTIVIRTKERRLYLALGDGTALRYPVAVGRPDKQWFGWARIEGKHVEPAWSPPAVVRRDKPWLPDVIPGGSPRNPMGARVIGLGPGGEYAIHGTNMPGTVGTAASYGCFRMHNHDVADLYDRVRMGTPVVVRP